VSPTLNSGTHEGQNIQPSVLAFAQNTRDEVRIQGDGTISGALSAQPGMKQTTYVVTSASASANGSDAAKTAGTRQPAIAFQTDHISQNGTNVSYEVMKTLDTQCPPAVCMSSGQANAEVTEGGLAPTLTLLHEAPIVIDRAAYNQGENAQYPPTSSRPS